MPIRLDRESVIDQVTVSIRQAILDGEWQTWLPGERHLSNDLRVGRNTLRAALKNLARDQLIEIVPGKGSRIAHRSGVSPQRKPPTVGLLIPGPIEALFPRQILWIDALRDHLSKLGYLLKSFHGSQYFQANPDKAINRLVAQEKCGCWILVSSSKATQQWFSTNALPCLIAGSCHKGIDLPFVDIDYRALCRHAATTFLRLGHRHIVYLAPPPQLAGDIQSEAGFLEGVDGFTKTARPNGQILHGELSTDRIVYNVRQIMSRSDPPTGLLIHNAFQYLTVYSSLTQMHLKIPGDVSLICRESENFLSHMKPTPACYCHNPIAFADILSRIAGKLLSDSHIPTKSNLLMPEYAEGGSVTQLSRGTPV